MKKNNLLKKGFMVLGLSAIALPFFSPVSANAAPAPLVQETQSEISPMWVYSYEETLYITYAREAWIEQEVHYEYVHRTYGIMRGVLKLQGYKFVNGEYVATFKGMMYSNPL